MLKKGIFAALLILMLGVFTSCGGAKTVDVFEYIDLEFSGLDSKGKAEVLYDDKLFTALIEASGAKEGSEAQLELAAGVSAKADKKEDLSNGDVVTVTVSFPEGVLEKNKVKLVAEEKTFTVSGLKEVETVDLFADAELVLEGASPFLRVSVVNRSQDEFLKTVSYQMENRNNVAIGDTVTVTATYSQRAAEEKGLVAEATEKVFTVEAADRYAQSLEELGEEALEKIKTEATDKMEAELAKNGGSIFHMATKNMTFALYTSENKLGKPQIQSIYLLSLKNGESIPYDLQGAACFVVFRTEGTDKNGEEATVFTVVRIPDLIIREDGSFSAGFSDKWLCNGYGTDEDTVYRSNIEKHKGSFTIDKIELEIPVESSLPTDESSEEASEGEESSEEESSSPDGESSEEESSAAE